MFFRGIGVSVVSLIIQACYGVLPPDIGTVAYGPPPPSNENNRIVLTGWVKANETKKPIKDIKVSVEGIGTYDYTGPSGYYYLPVPTQEKYILKIEDIDGPANDGSFKETTLTINKDGVGIPLTIFLDAVTEPGSEPDEE